MTRVQEANPQTAKALRAEVATPADVDTVHALLAAAGERLGKRGFPNWLPSYPRERVAAHVADGVLWVVRDAHDIAVATFTLRAEPAHPYEDIAWADPDASALYLNRLAVDPAAQGQGIGRWCLECVAELSASRGAAAVRCDVLQANVQLRRFYERHGYEARGTRFHSGWDFTVYERGLGRSDTA